jgi:hypothetical protein
MQESFEEFWYKLGHAFSDSYYSERVDSVTVIGYLHYKFILQCGLDGARIGGFIYLSVVDKKHRGL